MKVSVVMATYNGSEYLQEQLNSFLDQSRQPDELIVTDDCSTDSTEAIIQAFSRIAPFRVEFSRNKNNLGYCGNFNVALSKATGDVVFLSDQDDVWFPEKIEHMLRVADNHPEALLVMNDAAITDGELKEVGLTKIGQIRSAGLPIKDFVMGCCCGVRRELLELCMPIPSGFRSHDTWLVLIADALGAKLVDTRVLQYYRRHEFNESQHIANRTTKVFRHQAFFYSVRKRLEEDRLPVARAQLEQMVLFSRGIQRAARCAPEKHQSQLEQLFASTESKVQALEQRLSVREKPFLARILATFMLLTNGGYRNSSGLKAVIRDLLGH